MPDTADTDGAKPKPISEADTAEADMQAYMLRHFYFCAVIKGLRIKEKRHFNGKEVGEPAGSPTHYGCRQINVFGRPHLEHRLVWLMCKGRMPTLELDHADQDKLNNHISNLREVTRSQNNQNKGKQSNNKSGRVGVHRSVDRYGNASWISQIWVDNRYRSKTFSCNRYGEDSAKDQAFAWRSLAELNLHTHRPTQPKEQA